MITFVHKPARRWGWCVVRCVWAGLSGSSGSKQRVCKPAPLPSQQLGAVGGGSCRCRRQSWVSAGARSALRSLWREKEPGKPDLIGTGWGDPAWRSLGFSWYPAAAPPLTPLPFGGGSCGLAGKGACQGCSLRLVRVQPPTPTSYISHCLKHFQLIFWGFSYTVYMYKSRGFCCSSHGSHHYLRGRLAVQWLLSNAAQSKHIQHHASTCDPVLSASTCW